MRLDKDYASGGGRALIMSGLEEGRGSFCLRVKHEGAEDIVSKRDGRSTVRDDGSRDIEKSNEPDCHSLSKKFPEEGGHARHDCRWADAES